MGERKIERQERERERERGEREKNYKHKQIHGTLSWSCYNPLSYFNPVTRDKVGKKKIERETGWEIEKNIIRGDRNL